MNEKAATVGFKVLHWQILAESQNTWSGYLVPPATIWKSYLPRRSQG